MDRRDVLGATGALFVAAMAGCLGDQRIGGDDDDDSYSPGQPPATNPGVSDETLAELAAGNATFATDLYRYLADEDQDNLFFSPYSISAALAMTYAGAAGETATEMEETLHFTLRDDVHEAFAQLAHELADRESTEDGLDGDEVDAFILRVANALWGREGYGFSEDFLQLLEDYYGAGLIEADFVNDPDGERERINDWVAEATEDTIEELLPENSIGSNTVFVITNAIYFFASWLSQFDPEDTKDETFTAMDGTESTVPMMHQQLEAAYAELDIVEVLELPYVGQEVSMVLLLPKDDDVQSFEQNLTADLLFEAFEEVSRAEGNVALPRFEIETTVPLSEVLRDMGMKSAFDNADFSGMVDNGSGIWIDEIYHDAFVSVDEEGTEASAATAVVGVDSAPPNWGDLRFDRPFVFCIRDRPTNSVLFIGRVADVED